MAIIDKSRLLGQIEPPSMAAIRMPSAAPDLEMPAPNATLNPRLSTISSDPFTTRQSQLEADLFKRSNPLPPTNTLGKIGHTAANIGNILGDIFAPSAFGLIPGTQLYNERIRNRDLSEMEQLEKQRSAEGQQKQTAATTEYTEQRPEIERARILNTLAGKIVPKGFKPPTFDEEG